MPARAFARINRLVRNPVTGTVDQKVAAFRNQDVTLIGSCSSNRSA